MYSNVQQLHRELHVYYHHNTPPPLSAGAREFERGADSVEMEFPSGYTDPWPDEAFEVGNNYYYIRLSYQLCLVH